MKIKYIILLALWPLLSANAQTFTDQLTDDVVGDAPSKWNVIEGTATIGTHNSEKVILLDNKAIIAPEIGFHNYLSDNFTMKFQAYFDDVEKSMSYQFYNIRFWNGNNNYSMGNSKVTPLKLYRYGMYMHLSYPTNAGNKNEQYKEGKLDLEGREGAWRNITINYNAGTLKVTIDRLQIVEIPNVRLTPSMISIQGEYVQASKDYMRAIKNINVSGIKPPPSDDNSLPDDDTTTSTDSTVVTAGTGLEAIDEGNGIGWRLIGRDSTFYGNIGVGAVDLSASFTKHWPPVGATGTGSTAIGNSATASGISSIAMGSSATASGTFSTAIGYNTKASGESSVAMNASSQASGNFSTAFGDGTKASGNNSTAMGILTEASGITSTAMGSKTIAHGDYSTSMGINSTANDYSTAIGNKAQAAKYATALGNETKAMGDYSTAIGNQTKASKYATAMGNLTKASGENSTAMGYKTYASGDYSTAINIENTASGLNSFATGHNTKANGENSVTMGESTTAIHNNSLVIGKFNDIYENKNILFQVGNGTGEFSESGKYRANALTLSYGGRLDISGSFNQSSDKRLKKNIEGLNYGLNTVLKLNPVSYNWKRYPNQQKSLGLIAQEVQLLINEIVSVGEDKDKTLSLSYIELIPVLIKAIQEQQTVIENLKSSSSDKDEALAKLNDRIKEIESLLNIDKL
tara:strand:- start:175337 stop:177406 length:2070 start_codon:yes stop_codon:yes gene_type:complete